MENNEQPKEDTPVEPVVEETVVESPVEEVAQETERERNLKAETRRKQEELERLREENERLRTHQPVSEAETIDKQLRRMSDRELESYLNNNQYSNLHIPIREILDERRFDRYQAKREESRIRLDAQIEVEQKFPEVLNPSHPMSLKTKELMRKYHLENNPQGRLIAAELASIEIAKKKAAAAGRKAEQVRQADVKANFQGESNRSAPKVSENAELQELKKRAQNGDEEARALWFKHKGLI